MILVLVLLTCVWLGQPVSGQANQLRSADIRNPRIPALPSIAGVPYHEALLILERHREELMQLPGVQEVGLVPEGIIVYTEYPTALPAEIEGVPVKPFPPRHSSQSASRMESGEIPPPQEQKELNPSVEASPTREFSPIAGIPYEEALAIADRHRQELMKLPGVYIVTVGDKGLLVGVVIPSNDRTVHPEALQKATKDIPSVIEGLPVQIQPLPVLPPPSGVIVLRPGGIREQADSCPRGFTEVVRLGWRFCIDPGSPESIPALMEPPIAGIPYEKALAILERHREDLLQLPGVQGVGMGSEGISVYTENPAVLPSQVEGLPVIAVPPPREPVGTNHTLGTRIRPLHGGVAARDNIGSTGTLTATGLSEGKPWLIFPAHLLAVCGSSSPCAPASLPPSPTVNGCPHTVVQPTQQHAGTQLFVQPPSTSPELVGLTQRWDRLPVGGSTTDTAIAFMDNDGVEGNGSLSADRAIESWTGSFTGLDPTPFMNEVVYVRTMNPPHNVTALVKFVNVTIPNIRFICINNQLTTLTNQMDLEAFPGSFFAQGDSGSPVLDGAGSIVGMFNWFDAVGPRRGGGTLATTVRGKLGFDHWYGTLTAPDNTFAVFRSSEGRWYRDNGDGTWTGTDGDTTSEAGDTGDLPITGRWNPASRSGRWASGAPAPGNSSWIGTTTGSGTPRRTRVS